MSLYYYIFELSMERKVSFYGTPLSKSSSDDQANNDGPIQNRRARLNYQQTVRDSQGRQRFHGAFTGGFSAGYFNTVDTLEGFQPRQFVTRRGSKHGASDFSHKPEDYMDDEDFGEFGIAPKKIRVIGGYSSNESVQRSNFANESGLSRMLKTNSISIGESILQHLSRNSGSGRYRFLDSNSPNDELISIKNDFHGLGYKPLKSREVGSSYLSTALNPLVAELCEGKRLRISGEAFGSGAIEDEEGLMDAGAVYQYDHFEDYKTKFRQPHKTKSCPKADHSSSGEYHTKSGHLDLPGFVLAKNLEAMQISDDIQNYTKPIIPKDWKLPTRSKPYIPDTRTSNVNSILNLHQSSSQFNRKFVQSSSSAVQSSIETKAGLVLYSDLRATEPKTSEISQFTTDESRVPTISRQKVEWRPCSLLCKRFNVPNPYPDNLFTGVKPSHLIKDCDSEDKSVDKPEICHQRASLELKRSIFNVKFVESKENDSCMIDDEDSGDEPQVIELHQSDSPSNNSDHDILEVSTARREPEVIVLSSSSSTPSASDQVVDSEEPDTYGPPLPPSLKPDTDLDRHRSRIHSSKRKKKNKRHKKRHR